MDMRNENVMNGFISNCRTQAAYLIFLFFNSIILFQSLFFLWATGYNVIALPLAAGVLYNYEILLSQAAGAALLQYHKSGKM